MSIWVNIIINIDYNYKFDKILDRYDDPSKGQDWSCSSDSI